MTWSYQKTDISVNTIKMLAQYLGNSILEGLSYRKFKTPAEKLKFEKELTESEKVHNTLKNISKILGTYG